MSLRYIVFICAVVSITACRFDSSNPSGGGGAGSARKTDSGVNGQRFSTDARVIVCQSDSSDASDDIEPGDLRNGDSCTVHNECRSGYCVDSVCCENECNGICQTCDGDVDGSNIIEKDEMRLRGKCQPYDKGVDYENECPNIGSCVAACDGEGRCRVNSGAGQAERCLEAGEKCSAEEAQSQCATGYRADGVCCNNECVGACRRCDGAHTDSPAGTCGAILKGVDPEDECTQEELSSCGRTGVCDGDSACQYYGTDIRCDDKIYCNGADTCNGLGICGTHVGDPCASGDLCKQCNEETDNCFSPSAAACEYDSDPMTLDQCDGSGMCVATGKNYCETYKCWKVPPTGQNTCYFNESQVTCPGEAGSDSCASTEFCGQDAQYPDNSRTFTESAIGTDIIVTDSLTGLSWQKNDPVNKPNNAGLPQPILHNWIQARDYCNGLTYAGQTDWRLPDMYELTSLLNFGRSNPASDFPGIPSTPASGNPFDSMVPSTTFWSSSPDVYYTNEAWLVGFDDGQIGAFPAETTAAAKCVRGGTLASDSKSRFYGTGATGKQTVLDRATGLTWQKERGAIDKTWQQALAFCEALDLGGFTDWRLPNINELASLINYAKVHPGSDFPDIRAEQSWSSSTVVDSPNIAWMGNYVYPGYRSNLKTDKENGPYGFVVRCVRGGP